MENILCSSHYRKVLGFWNMFFFHLIIIATRLQGKKERGEKKKRNSCLSRFVWRQSVLACRRHI